MKNLFYLFFCTVVMLSFQSCSDDDVEENFADWKNENETAFFQLATSPDYDSISIDGLEGYIYRKILKSAIIPGDTAIIGSEVTVRYRGELINGIIFDTTEELENPRTFPLASGGGLIKGWLIALQHMTPGDRWEIWIPWQLGYGELGTESSIPPFSTLIFDIELISVDKYPRDLIIKD